MASRTDKRPHPTGCHPRVLEKLPRAECLQRIGMMIDSRNWQRLPLAAQETYLDILFSEP